MTRHRSFARRLSRVLTACVALALTVMVAASILVTRSWILGNMDSELHRPAQRAGEHLGVDGTSDSKVEGGDMGASADGNDGTRTVSRSGGRGPYPSRSVIPGRPTGPGFGESGISEDAFQYVSEDGETAGAVISNFSVKYLDERALVILADVPTDGAPCIVCLKELGTFRVTSQVIDSKTVLMGIQMDSVNNVTFILVAVEVGLSLVVAIVVGSAGRTWVCRELRSLDVVRAVTAGIASRDLADNTEELTHAGEEATSGPIEAADAAGALNSMIGAVRDGMERRARGEVKLCQFVADASYELHTPLASVQGYTQLAHRDIDDASWTQTLECISSEGTWVVPLVEEMLTLAHLGGDRALKRENADVIPLILDTLSDAHAVVPNHAWALDEAVDVQVSGDEAALCQILTNLLMNARVHTPAGIRVTIPLTHVPQGAEPVRDAPASSTMTLRIADDGPGIPAEIRDRIFGRFVRDGSSRTRDGRGSSGLGMSIVELLVHVMGGAVRLVDPEKGIVTDVILSAT